MRSIRKEQQTLSSSDAPWLANYPLCVPHHLEYPEVPAHGLLERASQRYPDRLACRYYRQSLTYSQLEELARRCASGLAHLGVQPGDRVAVLLPNIPEHIVALNGVWMAGATAVALSPLMTPAEVDGLLQATDARVVITLDLLAPLVVNSEHAVEHILFTSLRDRLPHWQRLGYAFARVRRLGFWPPADHPSQHDFADMLELADPDTQASSPTSLDDPAYILPTGGTTGRPKAVVLSHRNLVSNAWQIYHWAGSREAQESILAVLPLFHSYGLTTCLMTGMALVAPLIMHHRFIPRVVARMIVEHRPSIFPAVPAMLTAMNEVFRSRPLDDRCLQYCISGGAPLPPHVADEFAVHTGAVVVEGFGLSEASPVTHTGPLDGTNRPGTIGLPLPDTDARLVCPHSGRLVTGTDEVGELLIRGPQVMLGYWRDESATQEAIRGGWLYTGDLATRDQDGFFRIVDRKKDLIITSGFNVYPGDVERVLRGCPGIRDLAVVGVPDDKRGELVKAFIVPETEPAFDRAVFERFCEEHLSKHKRPREIEISVGDLPRNFLGKVLRRELRDSSGLSE